MRLKPWFFILLLTLAALALRWWLAAEGRFPFTWDFGRDMLWVRQLTIMHKPMLVGAWGSLDGTYFGPAYYYFLVLPLWLSHGDPRAAVAAVSLTLGLLIPILFWFGKRYFNLHTAIIWAAGVAFLPVFIKLSLYSFPQQLVPFLFACFVILQWQLINHPRLITLSALILISSLFFHFEPVNTPAAYFILTGVCVYLIGRRRLSFSSVLHPLNFLAGFIPFIPNLIFDLRHGWGQAQAFWRLLSGRDTSLIGHISILDRLVDRPIQFIQHFYHTFFAGQSWPLAILLVLIAVYLIIRRRLPPIFPGLTSINFLLLLTWNLFALLTYFIAYPRLLKDYYLYMLPVLYLLAAGTWLGGLIQRRRLTPRINYFFLLVLLCLNFFYLHQSRYFAAGPELYRTQQAAVDSVYRHAAGQPFEAYAYTPVVYDYTYQYLFSWYGHRRYGYIPAIYAYLPDKPEYVQDKHYYDLDKPTHADSHPLQSYLIIEPGDHPAYSREYWQSQVGVDRYMIDLSDADIKVLLLAPGPDER
jgi:hypothetical protein